MPAKKKPTMKEMEKVTSNIIHDLQIVNQKVDAGVYALKQFINFVDKAEDFNKHMTDLLEKQKKEKDERNKPTEAPTEADSKQGSK